jgi:hypothetical protein
MARSDPKIDCVVSGVGRHLGVWDKIHGGRGGDTDGGDLLPFLHDSLGELSGCRTMTHNLDSDRIANATNDTEERGDFEVTQEMIEAGITLEMVKAGLRELLFYNPREDPIEFAAATVVEIYCAMSRLRQTK